MKYFFAKSYLIYGYISIWTLKAFFIFLQAYYSQRMWSRYVILGRVKKIFPWGASSPRAMEWGMCLVKKGLWRTLVFKSLASLQVRRVAQWIILTFSITGTPIPTVDWYMYPYLVLACHRMQGHQVCRPSVVPIIK
jgi:hypothetical protein